MTFKPLGCRLICYIAIANLNNANDNSLKDSKDSSLPKINLTLKKELSGNTLKLFLIIEN